MSNKCLWDPVIGIGNATTRTRRVVMSSYFFRLCLLAFTRLRYLCLLIFFRRFLMTEPMQANLVSLELGAWNRPSSPPGRAIRMAEDRDLRKQATL